MIGTACGATFFALMDGLGKELSLTLPVIEVVWARYLFHTVVAVALLVALRRPRFVRSTRPWLQLGRGACLLGATLLMYTSLTRIPLAEATAVMFLSPVLVTLLAMPLLGEKPSPSRLAAVAIGLAGVVLVVQPGTAIFGWYALLPLLSAGLVACYMILTRLAGISDPPEVSLFHATAGSAIVLSLVVAWYWQEPSGREWLLMLALGLCGLIGHGCIVLSFRVGEASALSPFLYAQVAVAALISVGYFGDRPDPLAVVGIAVVVSAGLHAWYSERRTKLGK